MGSNNHASGHVASAGKDAVRDCPESDSAASGPGQLRLRAAYRALARLGKMRPLRRPLPLLALLAANCAPAAPPPARAEGRVVTSLSEIAGPWDIASFAGYTPVRLHEGTRRAFVDVDGSRLSYAIECNYSGNAAEIDAAGILHDRSEDGMRISTAMGCGPVGEAREGAFFGFFGSNPRVQWLSGGRVRLFNGRTELILERPEARRLANLPSHAQMTGRWVPQMALRLMEGNGHQGWGFQEPAVLAIAPGTIAYSGCGGVSFTYRFTADARIDTSGETGTAQCDRDSQSSALLRVLRGDPLVERIAGGGIALTAGDEVITLRSEAELRRQEREMQNMPAPQAPPPPPPPPTPR